MSRSLCLGLAALFTITLINHASCQDTAPATTPAAPGTTTPSATPADDLASLQAENAALKKEVSDAKVTIAELQAKLAAQTGGQPAATASAPAMTSDSSAPSTNAAPAGPLKALPLNSTASTSAAPGAPGTDAGPSRTYTVVKGDSLWRIAHKMYPGDTKNGVDKLQEANKDAIGGKPLKIGQVLVVPQ